MGETARELTAKDAVKILIKATFSEEEAVEIAKKILTEFDEPELVEAYPVVYRERVTQEEKDVLNGFLASYRIVS